MSEKSMNEKNERNLDSTVDEIMEEIREQNVSEVKDINEKEQKSEERPRKKKVTKTKRPSGHHVSGDGVDYKAASDEDRPVKKKAPRRKKKVVREETGLLDLDGAEEWRDEEETAVPPVIKSADILSSEDAEAFNPDEEEIFDDSFFDEEEEKPHRRTKRKKKQGSKKSGKVVKIVVGAVVGVAAVVYLGFSVYFMNHFYFNTKINGVNFSGKSVSAVESYMKSQVDGYVLTVKESDGTEEKIAGTDISLAYKAGDELQKLVKEQNAFLWPVCLGKTQTITASVGVTYDENQLDTLINGLECMQADQQVEPVNAHPEYDGNSYVVKAGETGSKIDTENFKKVVKESIEGFKSEIDMTAEDCYVEPKYTIESEEVKKACDDMNKYLKASITYTFGSNTEVVDKDLISQWVTVDDNMAVTFNSDAVVKYVQQLESKYDTYQTKRTFTTGGGNSATVEGGDYGWIIDEAAEIAALEANIRNGETVTREANYSQTAASHDGADWGNTYVEVDLTNQYLYLFVNGAIVTQGPIVTGKPSRGDATPQGVYILKYKEKDTTLRGPKKEDGSYEWESPVTYWMPFNGGIGLHDAPWQTNFGGDWYLEHGSRGCVNLQYDVAETVFNNVDSGTPVVCHY